MEKLLLGVGRTVITPPIGCSLAGYGPGLYSDSLADDLTATAFWFRQEDRQALMVSMTLCSLHNTVRDEIMNKIEERFGMKFSMGEVTTMKNVGEMVTIILDRI